jgi:hypothetical protein
VDLRGVVLQNAGLRNLLQILIQEFGVAPVAHSGRIGIRRFRFLLGFLRSACSSVGGGRTSLAYGGSVGVEALAEQRLRSTAVAGKGYKEDDDGDKMGEE